MTNADVEQKRFLRSDQEHLQQRRDPGIELDYDRLFHEGRKRIVAKLLAIVRPSHAIRLCKRFGYALTPQLVRSIAWDEHAPASKVFPTSYLNGLRGITALKVFTFHYTFAYSDVDYQPWGTDEQHRHFLMLPIIRYLYSGFTAHVFFGIAGYLTSLRLFQLLDKNDATSQSKVLLNVSGSLFRRAFRLYLPVFLITFITATYIYLGFYEYNRPLLLDHTKYFPGEWYEVKPDQWPSYWAQLKFWAHEMFDLTNIMTEETVYPWHDQHLWSILAEMRASLHLYGILMATALCRKQVRIIVMLSLAFLYFLWNHWEIWVYILGAVVAQLDLLLTEREQQQRETLDVTFEKAPNNFSLGPPQTPERRPRDPHPQPQLSKPIYEWPNIRFTSTRYYDAHIRSAIRVLAFLGAFYLLSYPIDGARVYAPGYMMLNTLIPEWMVRKDKFYPNIGTALLLLLLARSDPNTSRWRRVLTSPIPQYLGKISFALYLVHGPIMHAVGYMIPHQIWWMFGTEGLEVRDVPWALTIFVGWALTLVVSLCAADVWTREIEGRCVRFVKRIEEVAFVKKSS